MAQKNLYKRIVDSPARSMTDAGEVLTESESYAAPAVVLAKAPTGLTLGDIVIARSASTPFCYVNISWTDPDFDYIIGYLIEYSKSADFSNPIRRTTTSGNVALECDTASTYYIRVAAQYANVQSAWTSTLTANTPPDTTTPPDITNLAASFSNGDLNISWTEPSSETFKDARVRIYNVGKSILYATFYSSTGFQRWAAAANLAATSGAGVTSVVVQVTSRSWGNVYGNDVETGTITSSAPSIPTTVATSWDGDAGTAGADCTFSWDAQTLIKDYVLTIDGTVYVTTDNKFSYTHSLNKKQHATNTGDYVLTYSIVARNNLLQVSSAATGTATNAAPPAPTLTVQAFLSTMSVSISNTNPIEDLDKYVVEVYNNDVLLSTLTTQSQETTISVDESGSYDISVKTYDLFGRASSAAESTGITVDTINITELRIDASYTDSVGNTPTTLAVLKDSRLSGSGVSYTASADWRWILCERPFLDRYRTVTLSLSGSGVTEFYLGWSEDAVSWNYYYGTITDGRTQINNGSNESTAKSLPSLYSQLTSNRVDKSSVVLYPYRYIKLGFRNTTNTITIYEFYPRRLIQSDDIETETIKAINIGASQVTADKISVTSLSALSANMGSLTAGNIVIGSTNKIWLNDASDGKLAIGGTDKATAPFRVTAAGALTATSATISGAITATSGSFTGDVSTSGIGRFIAGGGHVVLDESGITINPIGATTTGAIKWSNANYGAGIYPMDGASSEMEIHFYTNKSPAGNTKGAFVWEIYGSQFMALRSIATATDPIGLTINTPLHCDNDIQSHAKLRSTIDDATTNSVTDCLELTHSTTGTPAAGIGAGIRFFAETADGVQPVGVIQSVWTNVGSGAYTGELRLFAGDYSTRRVGLRLGADGSAVTLGFFGGNPTTKPTALTAASVATVDATYGTEERDVINNIRTRVGELETKLQALGLLT